MRKKEIKGLVHDLLHYLEWRNPLKDIFLKKKIEVDLISKEVIGSSEDDLFDFYHEKIDWFHDKIKATKTDMSDFKEAKIIVFGSKEEVKIIFKDSEFTGNLVIDMPKI